jgi:hypothetical protein
MKFIIYAASAIGLAASLGGCATVTRGTTTEFAVTSQPPGAAVKTSTGFSCDATPCSMKVPRKDSFDVTVTKTGYVTKTLHVRSAVGGGGAAGMAGNVVLGGVIGMAVDGTDGAMDDLTPNPMNVALDAEVPPPPLAAAAAPPPAAAPAAAPAVEQAPAAKPNPS